MRLFLIFLLVFCFFGCSDDTSTPDPDAAVVMEVGVDTGIDSTVSDLGIDDVGDVDVVPDALGEGLVEDLAAE